MNTDNQKQKQSNNNIDDHVKKFYEKYYSGGRPTLKLNLHDKDWGMSAIDLNISTYLKNTTLTISEKLSFQDKIYEECFNEKFFKELHTKFGDKYTKEIIENQIRFYILKTVLRSPETDILKEIDIESGTTFNPLENPGNLEKAAAALNDVIKMSKKEKLALGIVGFSAAAATVTLVPAVHTLVTGCLVAAGVSAGAAAAVFATPVTIAFIAALAIAFTARAVYIRSQQNKKAEATARTSPGRSGRPYHDS